MILYVEYVLFYHFEYEHVQRELNCFSFCDRKGKQLCFSVEHIHIQNGSFLKNNTVVSRTVKQFMTEYHKFAQMTSD